MNKLYETDDQLRSAIESIKQNPDSGQVDAKWVQSLSAFLNKIHAGLPGNLLKEDTLKELFEDTTVSSTGNGSVIIAPAMANQSFREWFHGMASKPIPTDFAEAQNFLVQFHRETNERLRVLCTRTPRLKVNRVFCALYPDFFTTIADQGALTFLYKAMGGNGKDEIVHMHSTIRARIEKLLGKVPKDGFSQAYCSRLSLPWFLYDKAMRQLDQDSAVVQQPTDNTLKPWPAVLRRKGLTATKGNFNALLELLPELQEGVSRTEFEDLIAQRNPGLSKASIGVNINAVAREFDLCRRQGDTYVLTPRGINLLETQDPDELSDHLLTRILGIDHVLMWASKEPTPKGELIAKLQGVHSGWTSTYAPSALLGWLMSLDVIKTMPDGKIALTERGQRWCERISWEPEATTSVCSTTVEPATVAVGVHLPHRADILSRLKALVAGRMAFADELVEQLHGGLWSHPVRHFVVLSGISGSGKTQLALSYARALCDDIDDKHGRVQVIPVQPGWYDPSHLLGYVNPLQESSYRTTPFLDLLQRAVEDPGQPYVAILDEMNLSHPEQYLAPVLSAMETHGWIELHQLDESQVQIQQRLKYPANLAIVGTVNMDETTHGLSDKVLDRAYTLEFWDIDVNAFAGWSNPALSSNLKEPALQVMAELNRILAPVKMHFGWRTISDVIQFLVFTKDYGKPPVTALDDVIYAKVLPKLRGESSTRFDTALRATIAVLQQHGLQRSAAKAADMLDDLKESGSARFWR